MARGDYLRHNAKATTDDLRSFSIRDLKRRGHLRPGTYTLSWSCRGQHIGSIDYEMTERLMVIRYKVIPKGGKSNPVTVHVPFTFTPCHYGGHRKWFMCSCRKRVSRLFVQGSQVACRHCLNLTYASQREDQLDRLNRKIEKKKENLRVNRKGMHLSTRQQKCDEINRLELVKEQKFTEVVLRRFTNIRF